MADRQSPDDHNLAALEARIRAARQPKTADTGGFNPFVADRQTSKASRIAFELVGAILICLFLGWLADKQFGSAPLGALIGLFLGFGAGVANAYRSLAGISRAVGWRKREDEAGDNPEDGT